jgi:RNA polymerase sigma factor (sigma-70 family)
LDLRGSPETLKEVAEGGVFLYMATRLRMKREDETLKTSWTLVARLKNLDDREHWREFYELYRGLIVRVAMRAGLREEEAKDVLQETMASVSKNIGEFEANPTRGSFHAWLLKMTRWRVLDQLGKRMPPSVSNANAADSTPRTPTVERVPDAREVDLEGLCDAEWNRLLMEQAMKELQVAVKAEHYQIFHLLTVQQKPIADVAQMVGKSRAQVYLIKHRVTNALKVILKKLEKKLG